ncbi:MAG: glycosyltransferase family 4 protein [Saprospiraceae bacterium]|nr:glycosyltransferase family 4 protein [Saprospiraceae bacterium]
MKIGINARFLIKDKLEGIGWFCYEVINRMVQWYPRHEFYLFFDRKPSSEFVFPKNVHCIVLDPPARHPVLWYWWFEISIPSAVKKYNCDIFISMDGYASLSIKIPQYFVIHDLAYLHYPTQIPRTHQWYYHRFIPKFLNKATHIFANSIATKNDVVNSLDITPSKISVCYSGCKNMFAPISEDEKLMIRKKYTDSSQFFLFVGALHPRKNVHGLINAFNKYREANISDDKLVIIGRKAWMTEIIESAYNRSAYKTDIIFLENLDDLQLANITAAAEAAITPSFLEGFGVPVLEALYSDVPILCSNTFSLPEIAGEGAILFNPHDLDSMASSMIQFKLENEKKRRERIELGRIHRLQFTWDLTTKVICDKIFEN